MYWPGKAQEWQTADAEAPAALLRQHRVTGNAISGNDVGGLVRRDPFQIQRNYPGARAGLKLFNEHL
jgi:hypothetical protein